MSNIENAVAQLMNMEALPIPLKMALPKIHTDLMYRIPAAIAKGLSDPTIPNLDTIGSKDDLLLIAQELDIPGNLPEHISLRLVVLMRKLCENVLQNGKSGISKLEKETMQDQGILTRRHNFIARGFRPR